MFDKVARKIVKVFLLIKTPFYGVSIGKQRLFVKTKRPPNMVFSFLLVFTKPGITDNGV